MKDSSRKTRRKTSDAYQKFPEHLHLFLENSLDGILLTQQDGTIVAANKQACGMFQMTEEEMLRAGRAGIVVNDERLRAAIRDLAEIGVFRGELTGRRSNGSTFPIEISTKLFTAVDGREMTAMVIRDISERRRMEERLCKSEALSKMLFNLPQNYVVLLTDRDGALLDFNDNLPDRLGIARDKLLGKCIFDLLPPSTAKLRRRACEEAVQTRKPVRLVDTNGPRCFEHVVCPAFDERGEVDRIGVFSYDMTLLKGTETALMESEARWQFALEGAGDGLWDWDAVTNRVFFSSRWKTMLGYAENEIGDTLDEWDHRVHPDDKARVYEDLERHFRGETPYYQNEHRLLSKDGSYRWILDRGKAIEWTEEGKPSRVIGTHADITYLKAVEEELKNHRDRLEDLVQERTAQLERKTASVEELNGALKVLISQMQEGREVLEQQVVSNVRKLVLPYLQGMAKGRLDEQQRLCLGIAEANLNEIVSPFLHNIQQLGLTPRETQVANLIKDGKATKEIADIVGVAKKAIDAYRDSIRKKLGLNKKKVNLQSYLQSLR